MRVFKKSHFDGNEIASIKFFDFAHSFRVITYISENNIFGFFFFAGGLLSLIWLVILIVWCNVIRKKERSNQIFRKPLITISFLGAIIYFISVVVTILNGF